MASRGSQHEQDEIVWQATGLRLGQVGLDLRQPSDPRSLTKLLNARFLDERNVQRRNGHLGTRVIDGSAYPQYLYDPGDIPVTVPLGLGAWIYGFGAQVAGTNAGALGDEHLPIAGRGQGTFMFNGEHVVWTGDRLLVNRDGRTALGGSTFWNQAAGTTLQYGVPAYLPTQVDSHPPDAVAGAEVQTCLTATQRFLVATGSSGAPVAWVTDRASGALVDKSTIGSSTTPVDVRLFVSGPTVVCLFRDANNSTLYIVSWSGSAWSTPSAIDTGVNAFEVAPVSAGFHLVYRAGNNMYVSHYVGATVSDVPYAHHTQVTTTNATPNGAVAIGAGVDGLLVVWTASNTAPSVGGLYCKRVTLQGTLSSQTQLNADPGVFDGGIAVSARGVTHLDSSMYVVHASQSSVGTWLYEVYGNSVNHSDVRYRTQLASRSFTVGNEVFCWLRSLNSNTHFLVGGVYHPQVSGVADREEATARNVNGNSQALAMVNPDPLSTTKFTWARPFNTGSVYGTGGSNGRTYSHPGNSRIGDLEFLPPLSAVQYGKSVQLAGSHCRNWDGVTLGDCGFHDYPVVTNTSHSNGGSLSAGDYQFRVYAVRYNALGERFQSAALTKAVTGVVLNDKVVLTIASFPLTNHDDVVYEVYRTTVGPGPVFYFDGTVANTFGATTVTYNSTVSDATLLTGGRAIDPFVAPLGIPSQIENWGPLGCSFFAVAGDRLWGAGGQIPSGFVQFSKLHETGSGAGFDDLAELQEVDTQGGAITSILGWQDAAVVFQADRIYLIGGSGPNNYGIGDFDVPQMIVAGGAITHLGTAITQMGPVFWGADGPRLLTKNLTSEPICLPVRPLTRTLTTTGVQVSLSRQEVVWYTANDTAVLWNYQAETGRWAQWTGLNVAGCSQGALVTTDGYLLIESEDAVGDNGVPFEFAGCTGEIRPEDVLGGSTQLRAVGLVGQYNDEHSVRVRVYFNGAPLWSDEFTWQPETDTWLTPADDFATMTPAQVDALDTKDQSGAYITHKRTSQRDCHHFRVEWSDVSAWRPTFTPFEITLELGSRGGLGRVPVGTFGA